MSWTSLTTNRQWRRPRPARMPTNDVGSPLVLLRTARDLRLAPVEPARPTRGRLRRCNIARTRPGRARWLMRILGTLGTLETHATRATLAILGVTMYPRPALRPSTPTTLLTRRTATDPLLGTEGRETGKVGIASRPLPSKSTRCLTLNHLGGGVICPSSRSGSGRVGSRASLAARPGSIRCRVLWLWDLISRGLMEIR